MYTTKGKVRGECGHLHKTLKAAAECLLHDSRGCQKQGGYSDRQVFRIDDGKLSRITEEEYNEVHHYKG